MVVVNGAFLPDTYPDGERNMHEWDLGSRAWDGVRALLCIFTGVKSDWVLLCYDMHSMRRVGVAWRGVWVARASSCGSLYEHTDTMQ